MRGYVRRERSGRGSMGTKETSSGVGRDVSRDGDSALMHGAEDEDKVAAVDSERAFWAADLRSR